MNTCKELINKKHPLQFDATNLCLERLMICKCVMSSYKFTNFLVLFYGRTRCKGFSLLQIHRREFSNSVYFFILSNMFRLHRTHIFFGIKKQMANVYSSKTKKALIKETTSLHLLGQGCAHTSLRRKSLNDIKIIKY